MTLSTGPALQPTRLDLNAHLAPAATTEGASAAVAEAPGNIPQAGSDLTNLSQEQYNLEASAAVSLGFSVVMLKPQVQHDVLLYQVARYKDVSDQGGATYRFGVAVEATIVVTVEKFDGGITLPSVAANVQLGYSTASSDLAVRGYSFAPGTAVTLPAWGSFDVDSYTDFQNAVDSIVAKVLFDNDNIHPVLLATTTPPALNPEVTPPTHRFIYKVGEWLQNIEDHAPSKRLAAAAGG